MDNVLGGVLSVSMGVRRFGMPFPSLSVKFDFIGIRQPSKRFMVDQAGKMDFLHRSVVRKFLADLFP